MHSQAQYKHKKLIIGIPPERISGMSNKYVLEVYAEEAAFLWTQHVNAVSRPDYRLADLIELDERINAHLDGLIVAGESGWEKSLSLLDEGSAHLFPAAILAFSYQYTPWLKVLINDLFDQVDITDYTTTQPVISALGWLDYAQVKPLIWSWLDKDNLVLQYIGLSGFSVHRQDPKEHLSKLMRSQSAHIRAKAFRISGELKRYDLIQLLYQALNNDSDTYCQFWAAWALALLGDRQKSLDTLARFATLSFSPTDSDFKYQRLALQILFRTQHQIKPLQKKLFEYFNKSSKGQFAAIYCMGVSGKLAAIPWLIKKMAHPKLSKLAGEAFSMITGVDLDDKDLVLDEVNEYEDEEYEDEKQDNRETELDAGTAFSHYLEIDSAQPEAISVTSDIKEEYQDYIEDLPLPDADLIAAWWQSEQQHFVKDSRYLAGLSINENNLQKVLQTGFQRQRAAVALEQALCNESQILFNIKSQGLKQFIR